MEDGRERGREGRREGGRVGERGGEKGERERKREEREYNILFKYKLYNESIFQEPIPGWTDAETTPSCRPEEWRLQRVAVTHLPTITALLTRYFHYLSRYAMALDSAVLHFEFSSILARLRGDLVANRFYTWGLRATPLASFSGGKQLDTLRL